MTSKPTYSRHLVWAGTCVGVLVTVLLLCWNAYEAKKSSKWQTTFDNALKAYNRDLQMLAKLEQWEFQVTGSRKQQYADSVTLRSLLRACRSKDEWLIPYPGHVTWSTRDNGALMETLIYFPAGTHRLGVDLRSVTSPSDGAMPDPVSLPYNVTIPVEGPTLKSLELDLTTPKDGVSTLVVRIDGVETFRLPLPDQSLRGWSREHTEGLLEPISPEDLGVEESQTLERWNYAFVTKATQQVTNLEWHLSYSSDTPLRIAAWDINTLMRSVAALQAGDEAELIESFDYDAGWYRKREIAK